MKKDNWNQKYLWLFLFGLAGNAIGSNLLRSQQRWLELLGGFLVLASCILLGAFIYLAVSKARKASAK